MKAMECYRQVLTEKPDDTDALHLLGGLALAQGKFPLAEKLIGLAHQLNPTSAAISGNLALVYRATGRYDDAYHLLHAGLSYAPHDERLNTLVGNVLCDLRRYDEAIEKFLCVTRQHPQAVEAWQGLAHAAYRVANIPAAQQAIQAALALSPQAPHLLNGQAQIEQSCGHEETAEKIWRALVANNAEPQMRINLGLLLMRQGQWAEGFHLFSARVDLAAVFPHMPVWHGEPVGEKSLLVHGEQGLGDTLQFLRFLPALLGRAKRVCVTVPPSLLKLATRTVPGVEFFPLSPTPPVADVQTSLMSLPHHLGLAGPEALKNFPPLLRADDAQTRAWAEKLGNFPRPWVGLVWAGNPHHLHDQLRSIPQHLFLTCLPQHFSGTFFSLQVGRADDGALAQHTPRVVTLAHALTDYDATAALATHLDLMIAVDTSVAHAAASLHRPTWLLLHHDPHWCWHGRGAESAWYPSLTLFRQTAPQHWPPVLDNIRHALNNFSS